ncbi:acyltransferase [Tothia fuscella]|uniref:Acyltransferase n=1 Tax=Tothia fuscella TaxID=1048955 RepID=A0A9P4TXA4_9PEZI|nr:acyltransferase [Tothia fuscella]
MSRPKVPSQAAPDLSIGLGDNVGLHPAGYNEPTISTNPTQMRHSQDGERELIETMSRFRTSPIDFLREVSLHVSGTGWRGYDRIVGQPIFYPGFSEEMKAKVVANPMLQAKIKELALRRIDVEEREGLLYTKDVSMDVKKERRRRDLEGSLLEVSESIIDDMICKMDSKRFIRGAYYFITQLLTRAYHQGIHVSSEEVLRLHAVAEQAERKKQSIIFLPSHRSHVDYVSMQIICYRLGLGLPTVVAGDNLNFPIVGPFLQHAGAMWIRRSFGDDQLYSTLVQAYIDTLLKGGYNFECFIEGGRSRTGKLLPPKFGILGFLLESLFSGRVEDAIICPVSTQYDKVIEVDSYISELLGQPKKKENLADFVSGGSSILSLKLGRVDVRFHEPFSLREFINDQFAKQERIPSQIPTTEDWTKDSKLRLLRSLGYKVLSDINDVSVVMPTALIGTVILTLRGRGVGRSELVRRVDWLRERVISRGGRVAHFAGLPTETVVQRGLEVLGPKLVGTVQGLPEETYFAVDRFQLSFYRNMTIHLFILEALLSAALYLKVKVGGSPESQRMSYPQLRDQVFFLSQLFRGEFIFPPEGLTVNLEKALHSLQADNVVTLTMSTPSSSDDTTHTQPKVEFVELSSTERDSGRENYDFYCFLIWPFIEASWLGAISLLMLTPPFHHTGDLWLDMKSLQDSAQLLGKTLYHQGDLSYFEAVNKETLKNAYTRFEEEGIIVVSKSRDKRVDDTVKLASDWLPQRDTYTGALIPGGKLWSFAETISSSRREGKNRRDGATVATRVLKLVEMVGRELYDDMKGKMEKERIDVRPSEESAGRAIETAKRRRRKIVQTTGAGGGSKL